MFATWLGRITALSLLLAAVTLPLTRTDSVAAVSASDWKAGRIIDDTVFMDANSMSVSDIQNFLNSRVPSCDTNGTKPASEFGRSDLTHAQYAASRGWPGPPYVCLKNYYEVPKSSPGPGIPANNYSGSIPSGAISAAQMIYNAAQKYSINPKVLLVMIQKESAGPLTTDTWPLQSQYTYAMGAHCPDSGPGGSANCDSNYAGFSLQIAESAALLRWYIDSMSQSWWQYKKPYETNSILWNVAQTGCGAGNVYIESKATAALYTYTPYQPNAAALANMYGTGDGCSAYGNRNFWRIYNDWFGSSLGATVFKTPTSGTVYIQAGGLKFTVPSMSVLQDFGVSPVSIATVSQNQADAVPTATSPYSTSLSQVVKSPDSATVYLISIGKKYSFSSMSQLASYGYEAEDISILPSTYIKSIVTGSALNNYITVPSSNVFKIENNQKRIYFDFAHYINQNPGGYATPVSYGIAKNIPAGNPIVTQDILVSNTNGSVRLLVEDTYYTVPSLDVYGCWGFGSTQPTPLYVLSDNSFVAQGQPSDVLSCGPYLHDGETYIANGSSKVYFPSSFTTSTQLPASAASVFTRLKPTQASSIAVKNSSSPTVWLLEGQNKRPVPTMDDLALLGLTSKIQTFNYNQLSSISTGSVKLGSGRAVKANDSATVYITTADSKKWPVSSGDLFLSLGYSWDGIISLSQSTLNASYQTTNTVLGRYIANASTIFLLDSARCYTISSSLSTYFGQSATQLLQNESTTATSYPYFKQASCSQASRYIKTTSSATIYSLHNGEKRAIASWQDLVNESGTQNPIILTLSSGAIASFPNQ